MSHTPDDFERLVGGLFTPEQEQEFGAQLSGPFFEPLYPGREELLEHFEALSEQLAAARTQLERERYQASFLTNLAAVRELELGMKVMLTDAWSCVADVEPGVHGFAVFDEPTKVIGSFAGLGLGVWFNTPLGEGMPEDESPFVRPLGLFVCLQEVVIEQGDADGEIPGFARIPLNHGAPELYRVHCSD